MSLEGPPFRNAIVELYEHYVRKTTISQGIPYLYLFSLETEGKYWSVRSLSFHFSRKVVKEER